MVYVKSITVMAACLADSRGIGSDQDLPWSIPQDWEYFQRVTTKAYNNNGIEWTEEGCIKWKNVVIMGRLSWESKPMKGKALPNRFCVVLSRNKDYKIDDPIATLATSFDEAIHTANKLVAEEGKIFLLGGADVYNQGFLMPECRHILLTRVHSPKEIACDAFLAEIDLNIYRLADHDELESFVQETVPRGKQKHLELEYEFLLYLRK